MLLSPSLDIKAAEVKGHIYGLVMSFTESVFNFFND